VRARTEGGTGEVSHGVVTKSKASFLNIILTKRESQ
jgi:hypothetical protein